MNDWRYLKNRFNVNSGGRPGSIITPEGQYFAAVDECITLHETDRILIDRVIAVLNRELPDGKPRKRKAKVTA